MIIKDGTGTGREAQVDERNRLRTSALTTSVQHVISHVDEQCYQVWTEQAIGTSDVPILTITNTSDTVDVIITYLRVHTVGAAVTNTDAYFSIKTGGSYDSGGTAATPTNMLVGSAKAADVSVYDSTATPLVMSGSQSIIDKMHESNVEIAYRKEGSLILPKNSTLTIYHKGSTVAGNAYARVSFYMAGKE